MREEVWGLWVGGRWGLELWPPPTPPPPMHTQASMHLQAMYSHTHRPCTRTLTGHACPCRGKAVLLVLSERDSLRVPATHRSLTRLSRGGQEVATPTQVRLSRGATPHRGQCHGGGQGV